MLDEKSVLGKVSRILNAFDADPNGLSFTELSCRTKLAKPTVHRLIKDLLNWGLLEHRDGRYFLGLQLFALGQAVVLNRMLRDTALPYLQDLYEASHETIHLGVLDGTEVFYIEKISGHRTVNASSHVAGRMPPHCTALGKALLAYAPKARIDQVLDRELLRYTRKTVTAPSQVREHLQRARTYEIAYEFQESGPDVVCVSAPILDADGRAIAAISITGSSQRFVPQRFASHVREAARVIGSRLEVTSRHPDMGSAAALSLVRDRTAN